MTAKSLKVNGYKAVLTSPQETNLDWRAVLIGLEFSIGALLKLPLYVSQSRSIVDREEGWGEVEDAVPPPKRGSDVLEKHRQEVVFAGSMRGRLISQLKIGLDIRVGQGVKKSFCERF